MSNDEQVKAKEIAQALIEKIKSGSILVKEAVETLKKARGFWAILKSAKALLPRLARELETLSSKLPGGLTGKEKRGIALEGIMLLLPDLPWWAPEHLVRWLLGRAIDTAVSKLNEKYGKKWPAIKGL